MSRQLCDYGAPTTRKRLFVIARCDGEAIVWPEPTHGAGRTPYLSAATCIDWSDLGTSIFDRQRPLAEKTLRRIGRGMYRYVLGAEEPFVVPVKSWGGGGNEPRAITEPLRTITASKRGEFALVAPTLIQQGYGERIGQAPRTLDIKQPLGTVVAGGLKHGLVSAFLAKHFGDRSTGGWNGGSSLRAPFGTVTTRDHHALVSAAHDGKRAEQVRAFLEAYRGEEHVPRRDVAIADILMRMLFPRELYRAQGFPDSYRIDFAINGAPLSKTAQVRMVGNSVSPPIAAALVRANCAAAIAKRSVA